MMREFKRIKFTWIRLILEAKFGDNPKNIGVVLVSLLFILNIFHNLF